MNLIYWFTVFRNAQVFDESFALLRCESECPHRGGVFSTGVRCWCSRVLQAPAWPLASCFPPSEGGLLTCWWSVLALLLGIF